MHINMQRTSGIKNPHFLKHKIVFCIFQLSTIARAERFSRSFWKNKSQKDFSPNSNSTFRINCATMSSLPHYAQIAKILYVNWKMTKSRKKSQLLGLKSQIIHLNYSRRHDETKIQMEQKIQTSTKCGHLSYSPISIGIMEVSCQALTIINLRQRLEPKEELDGYRSNRWKHTQIHPASTRRYVEINRSTFRFKPNFGILKLSSPTN